MCHIVYSSDFNILWLFKKKHSIVIIITYKWYLSALGKVTSEMGLIMHYNYEKKFPL